jgi:hypothetical protein
MGVDDPNFASAEPLEQVSVVPRPPHLPDVSTAADKPKKPAPENARRIAGWPIGHRTNNVRRVHGRPLRFAFPKSLPVGDTKSFKNHEGLTEAGQFEDALESAEIRDHNEQGREKSRDVCFSCTSADRRIRGTSERIACCSTDRILRCKVGPRVNRIWSSINAGFRSLTVAASSIDRLGGFVRFCRVGFSPHTILWRTGESPCYGLFLVVFDLQN